MKFTTIFIVPRLVDYCCTIVVKIMGLEKLLSLYPLPPEIKEFITEEGEICPTCNNYFYGIRNYNTTYGYICNEVGNIADSQYMQVSVSCCSRVCMERAINLNIPFNKN